MGSGAVRTTGEQPDQIVNDEEPSLAPPYLPVEITDVEIAFPARALRLMPKHEDIERKPEWEELANDWFGEGVTDINLLCSKFLVDNGFEPEQAWRHLTGIIGSFAPKHEHKIEAIGYLLGTWFRWAKWTTVRGVHKEVGDKTVPT